MKNYLLDNLVHWVGMAPGAPSGNGSLAGALSIPGALNPQHSLETDLFVNNSKWDNIEGYRKEKESLFTIEDSKS